MVCRVPGVKVDCAALSLSLTTNPLTTPCTRLVQEQLRPKLKLRRTVRCSRSRWGECGKRFVRKLCATLNIKSNRSLQGLVATLLDNSVAPMDTQQPRRPIPNIRFRVLIIGRANAGKTSILQRVCDTTDSPIIYRGKEEVRSPLRGPTVLSAGLISLPTRLNLTRPWMFVIMVLFSVASNHGAWQRGEHRIDDELVFSNHTGYVFHDSRGIEAGSTEELRILQEFIRRKCGERRLRSKLHAIWFGLECFTRSR